MELNSPNLNKTPRKIKRSPEAKEEIPWDCSVCTFRNTAKAFKCKMCEAWKGTSSRKRKTCPRQEIQMFSSITSKSVKKGTVVVESICEVVEDEKVNLKTSTESEATHMSRCAQKLNKVDGSISHLGEVTVSDAQQVIQTHNSLPPNQIKKDRMADANNLTESKSSQISRCVVPTLKNVDRSAAQTFEVSKSSAQKVIKKLSSMSLNQTKKDSVTNAINLTERKSTQKNEPAQELNNLNRSIFHSREATVSDDQQVNQTHNSKPPNQVKKERMTDPKNCTESKSNQIRQCIVPRLKNVDRSTAQSFDVTVGNVTVVITEFKPLITETGLSREQSNGQSDNSRT
ncbi:Putative RYBP [Gryllus bimaculatus]|nr:Putative RYBP [Gryllus bimaculatus]